MFFVSMNPRPTTVVYQIHRRVADSKVRRLVRSGRRRLEILLEGELCLEVGCQYQRVVSARLGAEQPNRFPDKPIAT
jgi:predicted ATP-grasp superfamily ATP-dependent carboligase